MRLDLFLLEKKLAYSRSHAQDLIRAGQVFLLKDGVKIVLKKPNYQVQGSQGEIVVEQGPVGRFVSRGGLKLEGALVHCGLSVEGLRVLDVGTSTGGFSDCILQRGAAFVLGVDVGHGQLHPSLVGHSRLRHIEGLNAREIDQSPEVMEELGHGAFDLVVMDVSFISIHLIIPRLSPLLNFGGHLLSLVKPQFEVGPEGLGKGGIVKDPGLYSVVEAKVKELCEHTGMRVLDYFESPIEGKDGNREFFIFAQKEKV